jgi:hypothetical protein
MIFSLYAATIPSYQQILGAVSGLLTAAEHFCAEKGISHVVGQRFISGFDRKGPIHLERLFERALAQAVQDHVVAMQDLSEIVLLVVDDDIRPETSNERDPNPVVRVTRRGLCRAPGP